MNIKDKYAENLNSDSRDVIIENILEQAIANHLEEIGDIAPDGERISIFMGGGSGSGKSQFREKMFADSDLKLFIIDSDEMKELIPEYKELKKKHSIEAADIVHGESSGMASAMFRAAMEKHIDFLFDGTLKSWQKYKKFFQELRASGYGVDLFIVDVPVEIAIERAKARYEKAVEETGEGRFVDVDTILETHRRIPDSFLNLKNHVDSWSIYDTRDDDFIEVAASQNGEITIFNQDYYTEFLAKGKKKCKKT